MKPTRTCTVDGCDKAATRNKKTLCEKHYRRFLTHGDRLRIRDSGMSIQSIDNRFWSKVDKAGPVPALYPELGACWIWTAGTQRGKWNYGVFHPTHGKTVGAHRYSLEQHLSRPLVQGAFACHHCDTPRCVRPTHLYEGGSRSNVDDAVKRSRHKRGVMDPGAKLTEAQVVELRERASHGEKNRQIAAEFGINESLVSMITTGRRWAHVGGPISSKYKKEKMPNG